METKTTGKKQKSNSTKGMGELFGKMYSFNTSLKLYHWHVEGKGSYAEHIALDQALESLPNMLDRLVETSYSMYGGVKIAIPETSAPDNIVDHCEKFFDYMDDSRKLFNKDFSTAIIDDYQETIQQLLYRLRRLQ